MVSAIYKFRFGNIQHLYIITNTSNSIMDHHVINRVLIPLFDSVYHIADSFKDYSILVKLVDHVGISKPLISDQGPFTVFAPNNMAFDRLMYELLIDMDDL
eukprot:317191_1